MLPEELLRKVIPQIMKLKKMTLKIFFSQILKDTKNKKLYWSYDELLIIN